MYTIHCTVLKISVLSWLKWGKKTTLLCILPFVQFQNIPTKFQSVKKWISSLTYALSEILSYFFCSIDCRSRIITRWLIWFYRLSSKIALKELTDNNVVGQRKQELLKIHLAWKINCLHQLHFLPENFSIATKLASIHHSQHAREIPAFVLQNM